MTVWVVVLSDRHFDEVVDIFASKDGADAKVDRHKQGYAEMQGWDSEWKWHPRSKTWVCHDDGPTIQLVEMEVQP